MSWAAWGRRPEFFSERATSPPCTELGTVYLAVLPFSAIETESAVGLPELELDLGPHAASAADVTAARTTAVSRLERCKGFGIRNSPGSGGTSAVFGARAVRPPRRCQLRARGLRPERAEL